MVGKGVNGGGGRRRWGLPLLCPPPAPSVLSRLGPSEEAADISVRTATAGSGDSAAICYLMRR